MIPYGEVLIVLLDDGNRLPVLLLHDEFGCRTLGHGFFSYSPCNAAYDCAADSGYGI